VGVPLLRQDPHVLADRLLEKKRFSLVLGVLVALESATALDLDPRLAILADACRQ